MTKYSGKIESKERQPKWKTWGFKFKISGKDWNCFDENAYQTFNTGDEVSYETQMSADGKYENLIPESIKKLAQNNSEAELKVGWKNETICKNINENPDSLEIGTPSKGGAIKIYGNFDEPEGFIVKFTNAKKVRDEANRLFLE